MTKFYKISSSQTISNSSDHLNRINIEDKKKHSQQKAPSFWRDPNTIQEPKNEPKPIIKPETKPEIKPEIINVIRQPEHTNSLKTLKEKEIVVFDDVQSKWKIVTVYDI